LKSLPNQSPNDEYRSGWVFVALTISQMSGTNE